MYFRMIMIKYKLGSLWCCKNPPLRTQFLNLGLVASYRVTKEKSRLQSFLYVHQETITITYVT